MPFLEKDSRGRRSEPCLRRAILHAGIAVFAFVLTCAGLNAALPFPEINSVSRNLRFFQRHQDEFDTIFLGSSRVRHQISPAIFDRTLTEAGLPTRSLNFGVNGLGTPENGYLLERLLEAKPRRLKWVFIELDEVQTERVPVMERTRRAVYWHDWKRTSLIFRAILNTGEAAGGFGVAKKIGALMLAGGEEAASARDLLFFHGALFLKNFTNLGRKSDLSRWISHLRDEETFSNLGPAGDGFIPPSRQMPPGERAVYESQLKRAMAETGPRFVSAPTEQAYRLMADEVRKAGATPVFLVTPVTMQIELGFRSESGIAGTTMLFNNARAYPQLYRNEVRIDGNHLNSEGAREFTALVAENFSRLRRANRIQ